MYRKLITNDIKKSRLIALLLHNNSPNVTAFAAAISLPFFSPKVSSSDVS